MKLREIRGITLAEESLETKPIEDLWNEEGSSATEYESVATYLVRQIPKSNPPMFETFSVIGGSRKPFGKYNSEDLDEVLAPIRPNQTPDAEGFTTYVDPIKTEAFQYSGEPIIVQIDETDTSELSKGDYVTRRVKGKSFEYAVEKKTDFESTLKKA